MPLDENETTDCELAFDACRMVALRRCVRLNATVRDLSADSGLGKQSWFLCIQKGSMTFVLIKLNSQKRRIPICRQESTLSTLARKDRKGSKAVRIP